MLINKTATQQDYPIILDIWEKSVTQTHDFLSAHDLKFYKKTLPDNLDTVDLLLWFNDTQIVGFSGTQGEELVMLFLDPDFIGQKYGHDILTWLVHHANITMIDVNAQNKHAKKFYLDHGFTIASTDHFDGFGKPYPIDHLIKR